MKKLLLAAATILAASAASVAAEDNMLGCFTRTYDRAHLAQHPDQLVTDVKLRIYRAPEGKAKWFEVQFKLRGSKPRRSEGVCLEGGKCFVECDGGGFIIEPRTHDALVHLNYIRTVMCDEDPVNLVDGDQGVSGGKDDRVFRLNRVDPAECLRSKRVS
jgi:hypothetical protein